MNTQCPNCNAISEVEDTFEGSLADCPSCALEFVIRSIPESETPSQSNFIQSTPKYKSKPAPPVIVKTYKGSQDKAISDFQQDAELMAIQGYAPASQVWAAGSYGCTSFLLAALLCFVLIGLIVFIYMVIVKPPGTLTVTYQRLNK